MKIFGYEGIKKFFKPILNGIGYLNKRILLKSMEFTAGLESEFANPDALLKRKNKTLELYDTMMMDDVIKSRIELKKKTVLSVPFKVVPASEDPYDIEIADFCIDVIDNMHQSFSDYIDNLLDSMVYGFKAGEIVWKLNDENKWIWDKFRFIHSLFFDWEYNEFGDLKAVRIGQTIGQKTVIPEEEFNYKFIWMIYPYLKDSNYYGDSDLKEIYPEWWQKFNLIRWRGVYLQNCAFPVPVIYYDQLKTKASELTDLDNMFDNWQDLMRIKIPSLRDPNTGELQGKFKIDWKDINVSGGADQFNSTLEQINKEITRKLLIPDKIGYSGADDTGNRAQSEVFLDLYIIVIKDLHKRIENVINQNIRQLVDINFLNVENYPQFKFDEIDHSLTVGMLNILVQAGIIDKREKWIRSYVGIPQITEEEQMAIDEAKKEDIKNNQLSFGGQFPRPQIEQPKQEQPKNEDKEEKEEMKNIPLNTKKIEDQFDILEADFIRDYDSIIKEQGERLIDIVQRKKIIEDKDYDKLNKLQIIKSDLKKLFSLYYAKLYFTGKRDALEEVERSGKVEFKKDNFQVENIEEEWLDRAWIEKYLKKYGDLADLTQADKLYLKELRQRAFYITGVEEEKILKTVKGNIMTGLRNGEATFSIIDKIKTQLDEDRQKYALTIARTNASDSYNTGRMNTFMSEDIDPYIEAYMYSAIMDGETTDFCREHNGQIIYKSDPNFLRINPPNHYNCRSILIPVFVGDKDIKGSYFYDYESKFDDWGKGVSDKGKVQPAGFGGV